MKFNCVTGLNGSGKSNILDAICFVLGLQSFSLARANNIQDLVYKGGQSGVKEASVMISFDNTDKSKSPEGYSDLDTINVTRKISRNRTKFFINGSGISNINVKRMFKSIGLNIENPETFFVQQGKITKIFNFRPGVLLEMLEEAAGIGYYKEIAKGCEGVMTEKYQKLELNEERMNSFLGSKIKALDKERSKYSQFEDCKNKLASQEQLVLKLEVYNSRKNAYFSQQTLIEVKQALLEASKDKEEASKELDQLKITLNDSLDNEESMKKEMTEIMKQQKEIAEMEKVLKRSKIDHQMDLDKKSRFEKQIEEIELESQTLRLTNKELHIEQNETIDRKKEVQGMIEEIQERISELKRSEELVDLTSTAIEIQALDRQLEKLQTDVNKKSNEINSHLQTIDAQKGRMQASEEHKKQCLNEIEYLRDKIERTREEIGGEEVRIKLRTVERQLKENYGKERDLKTHLSSHNIRIEEFEVAYDTSKLGNAFNRDLVHGYAYTLFNIPEEMVKAVETGSGGSLYTIVVEDDKVSQALLVNKCFNRKVTLLPLNRVKPRQIPHHKIEAAKRIAGRLNAKFWYPKSDTICPPVEPKFGVIRDYVLGGYIITDSLEAANQIAFDKSCGVMAVTLDGDMFDPFGIINGGYNKDNRSSYFAKWQRYLSTRDDIIQNSNEKQILLSQRHQLEMEETKYRAARENLEKMNISFRNLKNILREINEDSPEQIIKEKKMNVEKLKTYIQTYKEEIKHLQLEKAKLIERSKEPETEQKKSKKEVLQKHQESLSTLSQRFKSFQKEICKNEICIEHNNKEIRDRVIKCEELRQHSELLEKEMTKREKTDEAFVRDIEDSELKLKEKRENYNFMVETNRETRDKRDRLMKALKEASEKLADSKRDLQKAETNHLNSKLQISTLSDTYSSNQGLEPLLRPLSDPFDPSQTIPALEALSITKERSSLNQLNSLYESLSSQVNLNSSQARDKLMQKMTNLLTQKSELKNNRTQIEINKRNLDGKSMETLRDCFEAVSQDFRKIFQGFLKGADAKMELIKELVELKNEGEHSVEANTMREEREVITGIEVKVSFNGLWKNSLSELSGGQRSLLALSFLLAMLKYRQSPFYILDEVDAAMDLSHTENIGSIISRHFPQSQFLVISLKEAMYSQANVVYRTGVVDGQSRVDRYAQKKA